MTECWLTCRNQIPSDELGGFVSTAENRVIVSYVWYNNTSTGGRHV
jgi:hypothetical protein